MPQKDYHGGGRHMNASLMRRGSSVGYSMLPCATVPWAAARCHHGKKSYDARGHDDDTATMRRRHRRQIQLDIGHCAPIITLQVTRRSRCPHSPPSDPSPFYSERRASVPPEHLFPDTCPENRHRRHLPPGPNGPNPNPKHNPNN